MKSYCSVPYLHPRPCHALLKKVFQMQIRSRKHSSFIFGFWVPGRVTCDFIRLSPGWCLGQNQGHLHKMQLAWVIVFLNAHILID